MYSYIWDSLYILKLDKKISVFFCLKVHVSTCWGIHGVIIIPDLQISDRYFSSIRLLGRTCKILKYIICLINQSTNSGKDGWDLSWARFITFLRSISWKYRVYQNIGESRNFYVVFNLRFIFTWTQWLWHDSFSGKLLFGGFFRCGLQICTFQINFFSFFRFWFMK